MAEVVYKEARKDSKRWIACEVMKANADKPMHEVLPLIVQAQDQGFTMSDARSYYRWIVENGFGPGVIEERTRSERKAPAQKKPTLAPMKLNSSTEEVKAAQISVKDKVAAIREKLLVKTKEVQDSDHPSH